MTNNHHQIPDCDKLEALLPAYRMGIADAEEIRFVERTLPHCPQFTNSARDFEALTHLMLTGVPQQAPPPHLKQQIMQASMSHSHSYMKQRAKWGVWAAAAVLLLSFAVIILAWQVMTLRAKQTTLANQITQQAQSIALLTDPNAVRFSLAPVKDTAASAHLICDPEKSTAVLVYDIPQLANEDAAYNLWLMRNGERVSITLLSETDNGVIVMQAPDALGNYQYVGVTRLAGDTREDIIIGGMYRRNG